MDEELLLDLHTSLGGDEVLGNWEEFKEYIIENPDGLKSVYADFSEQIGGTEEEFIEYMNPKADPVADRNAEINRLETNLNGWQPEVGMDYSKLGMMDLRSVRNEDFNKLQKLKEAQKEEEQLKSFKEDPFGFNQFKNLLEATKGETYIDQIGVERNTKDLGKDNKLSFNDIDGLGEDEIYKKLHDEYPYVQVDIPFVPGDDVVKLTGIQGNEVTLNLNTDWNKGKSTEKGVQVYNDLNKFLQAEEKYINENPVYKDISKITNNYQKAKNGKYDLYERITPKGGTRGMAMGEFTQLTNTPYNKRLTPETVLDLATSIKEKGIEAYGDLRKTLGSNFTKDQRFGVIDNLSPEEEEALYEKVKFMVKGAEYVHEDGIDKYIDMTKSMPSEFSNVTDRTFRELWENMLPDIKAGGMELQKEKAAKYSEGARSKDVEANEIYYNSTTQEQYDKHDQRGKNKIDLNLKKQKLINELNNLRKLGKWSEKDQQTHYPETIAHAIKDKEQALLDVDAEMRNNATETIWIPDGIGGSVEKTIIHEEYLPENEIIKSDWKVNPYQFKPETLEKLEEIYTEVQENAINQIKADSDSGIPSMTPIEYAQTLYQDAVGRKQLNDKIGQEEYLKLDLSYSGPIDAVSAWGYMLQSTKLRSKLAAQGIYPKRTRIKAGGSLGASGRANTKDIVVEKPLELSFMDLAKAGLEIEDFEGWLDNLANEYSVVGGDMEKNIRHFKSWWEERNEANASMDGLYNLAFVNNDLSKLQRESVVANFGKSLTTAFGERYFDLSQQDKIDMGLVTDVERAEDFKAIIEEFNSSEKVTKGEQPPIVLSDDQIEALEATFAENVSQGVAEFVPALVELGVVSYATGGMGGMGILKELKWFNKLPKVTQHAIGMIIEDAKMQAIFDMPATGGATFYALGTATNNLFFNKRFRAFKPLFDKVIKQGPVGAVSMEAAGITEAAYDELMGHKDFAVEMDRLFGDIDEATSRMIVNSIVFGVTGVHGVKKTDFMSTAAKVKARNAAKDKKDLIIRNAKIRELEKSEYLSKGDKPEKSIDVEGEVVPEATTEPAPTVKEQLDKTYGDRLKEDGQLRAEAKDEEEIPEGYTLVKGYTRDGVSYGDYLIRTDGTGPIKPVGKTLDDYHQIYQKDSKEINFTSQEKADLNSLNKIETNLNQLFINDAYAWKLNKNNKDFAKNFKDIFMEPMNQVLKSIDPKFGGIEIELGKGKTWRKQNIKNGDRSTAEWQPDWKNSKGEKVGRIVLDIDAYTSGKPIHELTHAIVTRYMEANPVAKLNFANGLGELFMNYEFGKNEVFEGTTGEDLQKRIDEIYKEENPDKRIEEFLAFSAEILGNPELYYTNPQLASSLLKEVRLEVKDIMGETGLIGWAPKNAADVVELLGLLGKGYRTGSSIKRKGKAYAALLGVDIVGSEDVIAKNEAQEKTMSSMDIKGDRMTSEEISQATKDINDLALAYETEGGNELWKTFGADEAIKEMKERKALDKLIASKSKAFGGAPEGFIDKVYAELLPHIRNYQPERQNESGLMGWIGPQIMNKATAVYNREYKPTEGDAGRAKQVGATTKEGEIKIDIKDDALNPQEALEAKETKSSEEKETDRQVSNFEGKEAGAKEKEIVDIFKDLSPEEIKERSKKGLAGTPKEDLGKVAELMFNKENAPAYEFVEGSKLVGPGKNLKYDTYVVHTKLEHQGKKILDSKGNPIKIGDKITKKQEKDHPGLKGILKTSEFKKVQDYYKDRTNAERFIKTLGDYSFIPKESRINQQGEQIILSKDVQGKGLGLPGKFLNTFYEPWVDPAGVLTSPKGRTKGITSQTPAFKLKPEWSKVTPENIKKLQDLLLVGDKTKIDKTNRGAEGASQLAKGMVVYETMKVANEATRKHMPKQTAAEKQQYADMRGGAKDIMSSLNLNKAQKSNIEKMLSELENTDLGSTKILKNILTSDKYKNVPNLVKEVVITALDRQGILKDIYPEIYEKAAIEKLATELSDIWGKEITPEQVKKIELEGEAKWANISKGLGIKNMNRAATSSKDYVKRRKATDKAFIKYMIPKGKEFKDLTAHQQKTIAKSVGEGDARGTLGGRRTTKKEYAKELIKKLTTEKRDITLNKDGVPKEATTADLLEVVYGKDALKGTGPKYPKGIEASYAPASWGTFRHKVEKFLETNPSSKEIQEFVRDLLTGKEFGYDATVRANINMLQRSYGSLVERFIKDPTNATLEDIAGLLQQQVGRATGAFKTYVPMHSVTSKTGEVSKMIKGKEAGKLHNEHETELLTMNRKLMDALKEYQKGELTGDQLRDYTDHMVERLKQSLITEQKRISKDASGASVADFVNKLLYLGKEGEFQLPLAESSTLVNMSEVVYNELAKSEIAKLKNANWNKLSELGVLAKQRAMNEPNYKKLHKDNYDLGKEAQVSSSKELTTTEQLKKLRDRDEALRKAGIINKPVKKARVFDFDDTVARTNSKVFATKEGKRKTLTAEEFAKQGEKLVAEGWKMDFSDFNKVVEGKKGPLFELMKTMKEAKGDRDLFILTARAPEAAPAIHKFLKEMGIDIPLENIKGLGDSSPYAKSDWILEKAAEGYNDFYFADDAVSNVKAVRDVLEQIDVKSQVQQALSSLDLNKDFNQILENKSGIEWYKEYSRAKGEVIGKGKGKGKLFLPPSAEDMLGLIYPMLGKGKVGEKQLKWFEDNLFKPYSRATANLSSDRVQLMSDFKELKKQLEVPKDLRETNETGFTNEQAVRAYLWEKVGEKIPGLSKTDLVELTNLVNKNPKLKAFADQILELTKGDGYSKPGKEWLAGTITTDLIELLNTTKRKKYLEEWQSNVDIIFSEANLNKLEAIYGSKYREALENMLSRMKSGRNRTNTGNRLSNQVLDYINQAQGTIMFLNMRSAVLQTISATNFLNMGFNNPIRAGRAFANQKQYWKDFIELMNSDYLVDRRNGLKLNISESEIANAAAGSKNKAKAAINYLLEKGYLPTKIADSFAIASGGATWYRNRIKDLIKKEGLSEAAAKKKAFEEFRDIAEKSQQSSDPSKISQQQSSDLGRVVLQFVNTPMQYTRIQKRAFQDIVNKRGSLKENIGKIIYYGIMQNIWFNAMQQGLFALGFGDGEVGDEEEKKIINTGNGMVDSILRGAGLWGISASVLKNTIIDVYERSQKDRPEYSDVWQNLLEFSPALKSKFSKLKSAGWTFDSKGRRAEIFEKGWSLDNPAFEALAKVISAATNLPLDRLYTKTENIKGALDSTNETWQRVAMAMGWPEYQLRTSKTQKKEAYEDPGTYDAWEQKSILRQFGYDDKQIKALKNSEGRIEEIIKLQEEKSKQYFPQEKDKTDFYKSTKKSTAPKTSKLEREKTYYQMTKVAQMNELKKLGLSTSDIKKLKYEKDRVNKLLELSK